MQHVKSIGFRSFIIKPARPVAVTKSSQFDSNIRYCILLNIVRILILQL